jgi:hypothetical protein
MSTCTQVLHSSPEHHHSLPSRCSSSGSLPFPQLSSIVFASARGSSDPALTVGTLRPSASSTTPPSTLSRKPVGRRSLHSSSSTPALALADSHSRPAPTQALKSGKQKAKTTERAANLGKELRGRRWYALLELLDTERLYLQDLQILSQVRFNSLVFHRY